MPMTEQLLQFLIRHFTIFGFDFQNWMPMMLGAVAIYVLFLWKTAQISG
jgi:hypothetical protein